MASRRADHRRQVRAEAEARLAADDIEKAREEHTLGGPPVPEHRGGDMESEKGSVKNTRGGAKDSTAEEACETRQKLGETTTATKNKVAEFKDYTAWKPDEATDATRIKLGEMTDAVKNKLDAYKDYAGQKVEESKNKLGEHKDTSSEKAKEAKDSTVKKLEETTDAMKQTAAKEKARGAEEKVQGAKDAAKEETKVGTGTVPETAKGTAETSKQKLEEKYKRSDPGGAKKKSLNLSAKF